MAMRECSACGNEYTKASGRFSKTQWLKRDGLSRCKTCVSAEGGVGGADGFGGARVVRNNTTERYASTAGDTSTQAHRGKFFAEGAFKLVYKGLYTSGSRKGEECVFKEFKRSVTHRGDYFSKDVKAAEKAAGLIERFNSEGLGGRLRIRVNVPSVVDTNDGSRWLLEPYVHNWTKFNSNTGWVYGSERDVDSKLQALSHYSYHASAGQFLLCDLQGGVYRDGVILSDPIILSREAERFGGGDLGPKGMSTFFNRHVCNRFCRSNWQIPRDTHAYFDENEGSSLLGNNRIPTAPYLHSLEPLDETDEYDDDSDDYW